MGIMGTKGIVRSVLLVAALVGSLLSMPTVASAAPPKNLGAVQNLAMTVTKPSATYHVAATWSPVTGATAYSVSLSSGTTTVTTASVVSTSWSIDAQLQPGQYAKVTVAPSAKRAKGTPASVTYLVPDTTAPTGTYDVTWQNDTGNATVTQTALSDDVTPANAITREIAWGDGGAFQSWATGLATTHNYAGKGRWVPQVRLTDQAGNVRVLDLHAVVVGDTLAPTGTVDSGPGRAVARWTKVTLTQTGLADNFSPTNMIERTVTWGDGVNTVWAPGRTITHVYAVAGTFTPQVKAADEAGNLATFSASPVTVVVDTAGPVTRFVVPAHRTSVKAWQKVKGSSIDAGSGTRSASLRAIEKRGTAWYAYRLGTWTKVATKAKAWKRASAMMLTLTSTHTWAKKLKGLRKGRLLLRVKAADNLGNTSTAGKRQLLTSA